MVSAAGHTSIGRTFDTERVDGYADYRSVYLPVVRDTLPESLGLFDGANASGVTGVREETNTSPQALYLLNNAFVRTQARSLATRLRNHTDDREEWVRMSFRLCYGRLPNAREQAAAIHFLEAFAHDGKSGELTTLTTYCQSLLAAAEFRYLN